MAEMDNVKMTAFPARTKKITGKIRDVQTEVNYLGFSDKILITVIQDGRISQWFQVPLSTINPTYIEAKSIDNEDGLLPLPHLTPQCLLGVGSPELNSLGQLYAAQVASAIAMRNAEETRTLVLGLGLKNPKEAQEDFMDILGLIGQCL